MTMAIIMEAKPLDRSGELVTVHMSHKASGPEGTLLDGKFWRPVISKRPSHGADFQNEEGNFSTSTVRRGSIEFRLGEVYENEVWSTYRWNNAECKIWIGEHGQPFSAYTPYFTGRVSALSRDGLTASLELIGPEATLDTDFLTATYAGTGGAEGPADMEGAVKPWCSGYALTVDPELVDEVYLVYQVHGYGPVLDIPAVYDRAEPLDPARMRGNVSTYAELISLSLQPSEWAVCLPLGMFRLGGAPRNKISADVRGAKNGSSTPLTLDEIIPHLLLKTGVPADKIGDFSAFAGIVWNVYVNSQVNAGELLRDAVAQAGGILLADGNGVWFGADFYSMGNPKPLKADRSAEPLIVTGSINQLKNADPVYEVKVGYNRCWSVHDKDDISPALDEALNAAVDTAQQVANQVAELGDRVDNVTGVDLYPIQQKIDAVAEIGVRALTANDKSSRAFRDEAFQKVESLRADVLSDGESYAEAIDSLTTKTAANQTAIQNESTQRSTQIAAQAEATRLVGVKADQNAAAIVDTNKTVADNKQAAATRMSEIEAEVDAAQAGIVEARGAIVTAISAETSARNIQISNLDNKSTAQIASESQTRNTQVTALVTKTDQISARLEDAHVRITNEAKGAIDRDAARASQINTVQSNLNGTNQTLALVQQSATTSSNRLGQVEAQYGFSVQAGNTIVGMKALANGAGTGQLVFDAPAVAFRNPGNGGAEQLMEFRNGRMTVRSAAIGDASIGSAHIQNLTVGTDKLAFYSVIQPHAASLNGVARGRGVGVWYDIISYDLWAQVDCDLFMWVNGAQSFPDGDKGYGIMLILDDVNLRNVGGSKTSDSPGLQRRIRVGAGFHRIKVAWHGHSSVSIQTCDLTILESKR